MSNANLPFTEPADLTGLLVEKARYPSSGGGYGDVYKGVLKQGQERAQVISYSSLCWVTWTMVANQIIISPGRNQSHTISHVF